MARHETSREEATLRERRVEAAMALLLRTGVVVAAAMVILGGALFFGKQGTALPHFGVFQGEPAQLRSVASIARGAIRADPKSLIMFGLLVLIATPILRVVFSIVVFIRERDRVFVGITLWVLAVLLFGLLRRHGAGG